MKRCLMFMVVLAVLLSTGVGQAKTVLTVWDQFVQGAEDDAMKIFIKEFESMYPDVEVKRTTMQFENMQATLKTAISGGSGPDIFYYNVGQGKMEPLVSANLVADLSPFYKERGWYDRIQRWAVEYVTFGGKQVAVANEAEIQGWFYHEDVFERLGLEAPQTWDDFMNTGMKLKAGKVSIPVGLGGRTLHSIGHYENHMIASFVPDAQLRDILFGHNTWEQEEYLNVVRASKEMYDRGLIPKDVNALSYDDIQLLFFAQDVGMWATGSWIVPRILGDFPDSRVGYFMPPIRPGVERRATKNSGSGFYVSSGTKNLKEAIDFLDLMVSEEAARTWIEVGLLNPAIKLNEEEYDLASIQRVVFDVLNEPVASFNMFGTLPEDVNHMTWTSFQKMWDGKMTPEELVATKQSQWKTAIEEGRAPTDPTF